MLNLCMLSQASSVKGQGVGSAYSELMRLLQKYGKKDFRITVNRGPGASDVIHAHTIDPVSFAALKATKKPTVISIHMTPDMAKNSMRLPAPLMRVFMGYIEKMYKSADHVHIVNPDLADVARAYGFKDSQIHYIPNFVAKDRFFKKSKGERRSIREKYGLDETDFVCFADGQTRAGKGVIDFTAVARLLPDIKFIWAGGFPFGALADGYDEVTEMMKDLPANVKFTGVVEREEINDLLNAADLFFFPSYQELFPMSILEAASVHLPLLLRDLPEYKNILTGRYMTANDNEAFAEAILKIKNDEELYGSLVEKSADISDQYSEERIYRQWKEFYYSLAGKEA